RHYLTVATPGNRAIVSCRTDYRATDAKALLKKAETIITAERPPLKMRDDPSFYLCKWCDYSALCHGTALPAVNCRTCAHSTARMNEAQPWTCELNQPAINGDQAGCDHHAYHPDLMANHAEPVNANPKTGVITFRRKDGNPIENGISGLKSREWLARSIPSNSGELEPPIEDEVRAALAIEMDVNPSSLVDGDLDEDDWGKLTQAVRKLSGFWEGDDRRCQALRAVIEQVDAAFMGLAE
ncbi:MAG TPA: hypothetical protein DCS21_10000, partial [Gammaproteobacteria bacterium]|nr:hypothetical protein [Gammaproteobacteria bacterium]